MIPNIQIQKYENLWPFDDIDTKYIKFFVNEIKNDILREIKTIHPMIDRLKFSGPYQYKDFEKKLYKMKEDFSYDKKSRIYKKRYGFGLKEKDATYI